MKTASRILGFTALVGTLVPPLLFFLGMMGDTAMKTTLLACCLVWFATAPVWMKAD